MTVQIDHLFHHPELLRDVAEMIYHEFWRDRPGYSPDFFAALLRQATTPDAIPLSLVALVDGKLAGTINLIENDDADRPHLRPWLAALVVAAPLRGHGIGTQLVKRLKAEARRLGCNELYLGTDAPPFYSRLGAVWQESTGRSIEIMRLPL